MAYLGGNPKPLYYMLYERPSLYILQYSLHILHSLYDLAVCINVLTKQHPSVVLIIYTTWCHEETNATSTPEDGNFWK